MRTLFALLLLLVSLDLTAQDFYLGADLSYVNEMEDCGVVYREEGSAKDPYIIFADHGANLVRLRLWHTPAWYDELNEGRRYSDLADVKRSIRRAKAENMEVLLDFHFSDFWTDPSRQIIPSAWAEVVDDLPVLQDSLYQYVRATLLDLAEEGLLPDMIQVGNETNKGIMQSEEADAAGWALDWPRNAALFNTAIGAIREVEEEVDKEIIVALHIAGPENAAWLLAGFWDNGVRDFDLVGLSYYWAWHQPTTIERTGEIISEIKRDFPGKQVMIFETGYIWTTESNDEANNIISSVQEGYAPASPEHQRQWLIDLTQEVYDRGGSGVLYWEPAWVSSRCFTQWGRGSHQEHAAFFDFNSNLLISGGIDFLGYDYAGSVSTRPALETHPFRLYVRPDGRSLVVERSEPPLRPESEDIQLMDMNGRELLNWKLVGNSLRDTIPLPTLPGGAYLLQLRKGETIFGSQVVILP